MGCTKVATCDVQRDPALSGENDDVSGTVTFTQEVRLQYNESFTVRCYGFFKVCRKVHWKNEFYR